jgi:hypothetical protein
MSNDDEFWKAIADTDFTQPPPITHKIYYNSKGFVIDVTTEEKDGDYITVDFQQSVAVQNGKYKVKDGVLYNVSLSGEDNLFLEKAEEGKFKTLKNDMLILADESITEKDFYVSK